MKKLIILILLFAVGKVVFDKVVQNAAFSNVDRNMVKIAAEINQQLPMRIDASSEIQKVEYENRVMRYFVVFKNGQELSDEMRNNFQRELKNRYCRNATLAKNKIGVEYQVTKFGLRSLNDKVSSQTWTMAVQPSECS